MSDSPSPRREAARIEVRVLHASRRFTEFAIVDPRSSGASPLRTEVLRDNRSDSHFCRSCKSADACRHVDAVLRFSRRQHMEIVT